MICPLSSDFFFKQKTAYEMRISDWSSDVCSSDLAGQTVVEEVQVFAGNQIQALDMYNTFWDPTVHPVNLHKDGEFAARISRRSTYWLQQRRSEEHTSELQSLMRISYAVFCLKKKNKKTYTDKEKS